MIQQPQWCTECGQPMTQRPDGAYLKCCTGHGYWSEALPEQKDERAYRQMGGKVYMDRGAFSYRKHGPIEPIEVVKERERIAAEKVAQWIMVKREKV